VIASTVDDTVFVVVVTVFVTTGGAAPSRPVTALVVDVTVCVIVVVVCCTCCATCVTSACSQSGSAFVALCRTAPPLITAASFRPRTESTVRPSEAGTLATVAFA
jgi:hypothetical protein